MVGRETLDTQLNVFESFDPDLPAAYRDTPFVFLANIHPSLQLKVLDQVRRPRLVAADTMNFWISGALDDLLRVLRRTDLLIVNDEEARQLSGHHSLVRAAAAVRAMGPSRLVIKRGDAGALLFDEAGIFWTPALPLENVVDPTGAGDTFAGGLVSYLTARGSLDPREMRRAMIYASSAASFCVEDFSLDRLKTLRREEVLDRCRRFADLVRFEDVTL
jgi:sugar/nucleoside kinase (ribokinase family)